MPVYVPDPENLAPAADLIEELGAELAARYAAAEDDLIREIAKRSYRDIALQQILATATLTAEQTKKLSDRAAQNRAFAELAAYRAQSIRELQFLAVEVTEKLRRAGLAQELIDIAAKEGEAAAAARLRMATRLPSTSALTGTATQAVASLTMDLSSRLEAMHLRITRYPQDAYQKVISLTSSSQILTGQTTKVAQAQAVQQFLSQGITGFVDKAERNWRIGSYAEMAGRTAVRRAYEDAGIWRMQQSGLNLVTIVGGIDACKKCAPWIGKILSTNGQTGIVELPHSTENRMVSVTIAGTLDSAKAAGWGHPNCRDRAVAYLPGLTIPQEDVEYSPEREAERAKQRELERGIRAAKRDVATAGDDVTRRRALREVSERQAGMREFIKDTGRNRANYREQLHFADGKGGMPRPNAAPKTPNATPPGRSVQSASKPVPNVQARITNAKTSQDVGDVLRDAMEKSKIKVSGFDVAGVDVDTAKAYASAITKMTKKYPSTILESVTIAPIRSRGVIAQASAMQRTDRARGMTLTNGTIQFNQTVARNRAGLIKDVENAANLGHFFIKASVDPAYYAVVHEFGHILDYTAHKRIRRELPGMLRAEAKLAGVVKGTSEYDEWFKINASGYGRAKPGEMVAEAFADVEVNGTEASPLNRRIHRRLIELVGEETAP